MMRSISLILIVTICLAGCSDSKPDYGKETQLALPGQYRQVWAIAPAINLSGQKTVDPILQADLLYQQIQEPQVAGLTVIPVNRVVDVLIALHIDQVQSDGQAALVCDILNCDALLVSTVTIHDPYEPPKMGASLTLFRRGDYRRPVDVDPRELARRMAPSTTQSTLKSERLLQVSGMFDAANGSTRAEVMQYAQGRNDPSGPYRERSYLIDMDRYSGFVYHALMRALLEKMAGQGK